MNIVLTIAGLILQLVALLVMGSMLQVGPYDNHITVVFVRRAAYSLALLGAACLAASGYTA